MVRRTNPAKIPLLGHLTPILKRASAVGVLALSACHERVSAPSASENPLDSSCQHDWECVPAPECCPMPCNEDVINQRDEQRARDALDCSSSAQRGCPQAGGCRTFAYLCLDRRCKLAFEGDPGFRLREAPP